VHLASGGGRAGGGKLWLFAGVVPVKLEKKTLRQLAVPQWRGASCSHPIGC